MLSTTKHRIQANAPYLAFFVGLSVLMVYLYWVTYSYRLEETSLLPRVVIIISLVFILLDILITVFPQFVPEGLTPDSSVDSGFEQREMVGIDVLVQFGWVFAFLASLYYIGFFTTTLAFPFLYILINGTESSQRRRLASAAIWTLGINGFLWILFIELMQVSSVFGLGFLP